MGIYDRDYYREDSRWSNPFSRSQGTLFLCLLYFFMFIAQVATEVRGQQGGQKGFTEALELNVDQTLKGEVWRLITYAMIHRPGDIFSVVFAIGFLIWIGHQVEDIYGSREYLAYYVFTTLFGGVVYTGVGVFAGRFNLPALIGPSGAVTSVLILFALHYPSWRILVFPIWLVIAVYAFIDVAGLAGGVANPARVAVHLAGAAFAFVYHTYSIRIMNWLPSRGGSGRSVRRQSKPRLRVRQQRPEPEPAATATTLSAGAAKSGSSSSLVDEHLEAKLDRVLEKVQKHGKESLTDMEREILLKASEIYKKRRQSS